MATEEQRQAMRAVISGMLTEERVRAVVSVCVEKLKAGDLSAVRALDKLLSQVKPRENPDAA